MKVKVDKAALSAALKSQIQDLVRDLRRAQADERKADDAAFRDWKAKVVKMKSMADYERLGGPNRNRADRNRGVFAIEREIMVRRRLGVLLEHAVGDTIALTESEIRRFMGEPKK